MTCLMTWIFDEVEKSHWALTIIRPLQPFTASTLQHVISLFLKKMTWIDPWEMETNKFVDPLLTVHLCNCTLLLGVCLPFIRSVRKSITRAISFLPLFNFCDDFYITEFPYTVRQKSLGKYNIIQD